MNNRYWGILAVLVVLIAVVVGLSYLSKSGNTPPDQTGTTTPPVTIDTSGWLTATSTSAYDFKYPREFDLQFVQPVDWPPVLRVISDKFSCTAAGTETAQAGKTELITLGGKPVCLTREVEGAAGSMYTQYAYAFELPEGTGIFTFTFRQPQCGNYGVPTSTVCQAEEDAFDLNPLIQAMIGTVHVRM